MKNTAREQKVTVCGATSLWVLRKLKERQRVSDVRFQCQLALLHTSPYLDLSVSVTDCQQSTIL